MNYELNTDKNKPQLSFGKAITGLWPLVSGERRILFYATLSTLTNSLVTLIAPLLIAYVIDTYIVAKDFSGVLVFAVILFVLYSVRLLTTYLQTRLMGGLGQRVLFRLRSQIFTKLQELPVAFFNANKTGDLISRINNDTDALNQFFSQTLVRFIGSVVVMFGAAGFVLVLNFKLGLAALIPALALFVFTRVFSPWVKRTNAVAMRATGLLSAEIAESLVNFKIVVAFNRQDFFRARFAAINTDNYRAQIVAGIANNTFLPVFSFASNIAQLIVLAFGAYLIADGEVSIGILVSFLSYTNNFYNPLRQLASLWANFQVALAGWDRISAILQLDNNMVVLPISAAASSSCVGDIPVIEFADVSFSYSEPISVLNNINLRLEAGKTYALVGPTGGGKTTTASLMARLFDPTEGVVYLNGRDIRTYSSVERTKKIGFILQEPILFSGTVGDNIVYGNDLYKDFDEEALLRVIHEARLDELLVRFSDGLATAVTISGNALSLGQRQLVAFMRVVLRRPELLILDEATANIDMVTEQLLGAILEKLPAETTRIIIAHRLNTIENVDEIFFSGGGTVLPAGSMEHAVEMLSDNTRIT